MTILDLLKLIKRYIFLVIALPVLCVALVLLWQLFAQASYTASAIMITNGDLGFAQGLANREAAAYTSSDSSIVISSSLQNTSKQLTVTAKGSNADECVNAANTVISKTVEEYRKVDSVATITVADAKSAEQAPSPLLRFCFTALVIGLALSVAIIVLIDTIKAPIKSREDAVSSCKLPVLGNIGPEKEPDWLFANFEFCCDRIPSTTAVVPIGESSCARLVSERLATAFVRNGIRSQVIESVPDAKELETHLPGGTAVIISCLPMAAGTEAAYIARQSDATILCVVEWEDSKRMLASTLRELRLAEANVVGLAYFPKSASDAKTTGVSRASEAEG